MTPFNPENKERPTYGDILFPLLNITDQEDAYQYLQQYIGFLKRGVSRGSTQSYINDILGNIRTFGGHCSDELTGRALRLFGDAGERILTEEIEHAMINPEDSQRGRRD